MHKSTTNEIMKNVWVFGSNGMLGSYVCRVLCQSGFAVHCVQRSQLDIDHITSYTDIERVLADATPHDVIVNCAGVIPQRNDADLGMYIRINTVFPLLLSFVAQKKTLHMIHVSTDCVFDGKNCGNYTEDDEPTETGWYGLSKAMGDFAVACIIRTSIIGEDHGNCSFLGFCRRNSGHPIQGYSNHLWNGMTCLQLAQIISTIVTDDRYWEGVRHLFSPTILSKYELAHIINRCYDLRLDILPVETAVRIDKTLSTKFDTNSSFDIAPIHDQIQDLYQFSQQGTHG